MPGELDFDMSSAVDSISEGLGFGGEDAGGNDDVELDVTMPDAAEEQSAVESEVTPPADTTPESETDVTAETTASEPPKTWRKEAAAEWAKLSPVVQAEIAKREDDIFKGIEGYKADASFGKNISNVLAPYMPILQQHNIDPVAQISGLMQAHHTLALGSPEEKLALFHRLAADYGVPLEGGVEAPYVDPTVKNLQTELTQLKSTLQNDQLEKQKAEYTRQIEAFSADPKNIYFSDQAVVKSMGDLLSQGKAKNLQEAYEAAIWLNPVIREKEIARQQTEKAQEAAKQAKVKAEEAKKASASNVKTRAKSATTAGPLGSIEDTLAETLATIKARG